MDESKEAAADAKLKEDGPASRISHVNKLEHSYFSNVEVQFNTHQNHTLNVLYAHNYYYYSINFKRIVFNERALSATKSITATNFFMKERLTYL